MNINAKQICLAIDHAPIKWHPKLMRSNDVIENLSASSVNAVYGTYGTVSRNVELIKKKGWDVGLRVDGNETDFRQTWTHSNDWVHFYSPQVAKDIGANFIVMNLCLGVKFELQSIKACAKAILEAAEQGITTVVSCIPFKEEGGEYGISQNPLDHIFACLQARELGADKVILYSCGNDKIVDEANREINFEFWTAGFSPAASKKFYKSFVQSSSTTACVGEQLWSSDNVDASARELRECIQI